MPIYEYECEKCGEKFELRRSFNDSDDELKCPKCGEQKVKRAISVFASGGGSDLGCMPTPSGGG